MSEIRNIILKTILIILLIISAWNALSDNSLFDFYEEGSNTHISELTKKAFATFAIARGLNGAISILQETEIELFGIHIALGEALDPLNDLVEKFSTIMLVSLTSLSIQLIILNIGNSMVLNLLLPISIFIYLLCYVPIIRDDKKVRNFLTNLSKIVLLIFFLIRLFIPIEVLISKSFEGIIMNKYDSSINTLKEIDNKFEEEVLAVKGNESQENSFFSNIKEFGEKVKDKIKEVNIRKKLNEMVNLLKNSVPYIIDLITIFIVQTILLPIVTLLIAKAMVEIIFKISPKTEEIHDNKKKNQVISAS